MITDVLPDLFSLLFFSQQLQRTVRGVDLWFFCGDLAGTGPFVLLFNEL